MSSIGSHLAHYATPHQDDARVHVERPCAGESGFALDRQRILRCSAFRRLDYKTQVFVPHEHDLFRTRLTHTLEVAQVARTLSRGLGVNEDLAEAVALAHDLGHAPFGHVGESTLNQQLAAHGGFDHNQHSLRVVDYLEHPFPDFRGLNLTQTTRQCIAQHETPYDSSIESVTFAPIEGQLVDLADQIAFTVADLEDALMAAWIDEQGLSEITLWRDAHRQAQEAHPNAKPIFHRIGAVRNVLQILCEDAIITSKQALATLNIDSPQAVRNAPQRCATLSKRSVSNLKQMQAYLMKNVYQHEKNQKPSQEAREILTALFAAYLADATLLPLRYRTRVGQVDSTGTPQSLHRVICDYLAGMTDRYCKQQWAAVCNPAL